MSHWQEFIYYLYKFLIDLKNSQHFKFPVKSQGNVSLRQFKFILKTKIKTLIFHLYYIDF